MWANLYACMLEIEQIVPREIYLVGGGCECPQKMINHYLQFLVNFIK